jgi:hypothetical protein
MKNLKARRKLIAILAISLAASMAIPFALSAPPMPASVIPTQCTTAIPTGWVPTPIINVRMTIHNDEASGFFGSWALEDYARSVVVWIGPSNGTVGYNYFCALVQYTGIAKTFALAKSPMNGVVEPKSGVAKMIGMKVEMFAGAFLGNYCNPAKRVCTPPYSTMRLAGNIGKQDWGGSVADILAGTYNTPGYVNWLSFYFAPGYSGYTEPLWTSVYSLGHGMGIGNMWVNTNGGSSGDIVT